MARYKPRWSTHPPSDRCTSRALGEEFFGAQESTLDHVVVGDLPKGERHAVAGIPGEADQDGFDLLVLLFYRRSGLVVLHGVRSATVLLCFLLQPFSGA